MQQLLDRGLVPLAHPSFELVARGSEARPTHQVSHQADVFLVCHLRGLLRLMISLLCRVTARRGVRRSRRGSRKPAPGEPRCKQRRFLPFCDSPNIPSVPRCSWERTVAIARPGQLSEIKNQARSRVNRSEKFQTTKVVGRHQPSHARTRTMTSTQLISVPGGGSGIPLTVT